MLARLAALHARAVEPDMAKELLTETFTRWGDDARTAYADFPILKELLGKLGRGRSGTGSLRPLEHLPMPRRRFQATGEAFRSICLYY